jgi:hypothetical protein
MTDKRNKRLENMPVQDDADTVLEEPAVKDEPTAKPTAASKLAARIKGAQFLGGAWYAADGSLLNDVEAQAAHRAMDKKAAEDRAKALGGG